MFYSENQIDLHGCEILEAVEFFVKYYNNAVQNKNLNPIRIIHGYGSKGTGGNIRIKLRRFLEDHKDKLLFQFGEHVSGNIGETFVYPKRVLPSNADLLSCKILEYCAAPKSKSKIMGKFRGYGDVKVVKSLRNLEKQGKISVKFKGKHKLFCSLGERAERKRVCCKPAG